MVLRRPYIDAGVALIKETEDGEFHLVESTVLNKDREVSLQINLTPGKYIILPRTTGGLMASKPADLAKQ